MGSDEEDCRRAWLKESKRVNTHTHKRSLQHVHAVILSVTSTTNQTHSEQDVDEGLMEEQGPGTPRHQS